MKTKKGHAKWQFLILLINCWSSVVASVVLPQFLCDLHCLVTVLVIILDYHTRFFLIVGSVIGKLNIVKSVVASVVWQCNLRFLFIPKKAQIYFGAIYLR